jgi:hypothetical protein
VDTATKLREEAREHERIALLEREQARINRALAMEEQRRLGIAKRLDAEIKKLETLKRQ